MSNNIIAVAIVLGLSLNTGYCQTNAEGRINKIIIDDNHNLGTLQHFNNAARAPAAQPVPPPQPRHSNIISTAEIEDQLKSSELIPNSNPPALHHAAATGDVQCVLRLLDQGEGVNEVDPMNGWKPLHYAVFFGSIEVTKAVSV
jgi:hypothetical protein